MSSVIVANRKLFVSNRGEVAVRLIHTASHFPLPSSTHTSAKASEVSFETVSVHTAAESAARHVVLSNSSIRLQANGPRAYLDIENLVLAAKQSGSWGVIPGYGFLSESAAFATAVEEAGMVFVGPTPEQLALFGDKTRARALARQCSVPLLPGTDTTSSADEVSAFALCLPPGAKIMLKAVAGGGGRGMSLVDMATTSPDELVAAYEACQREAKGAFDDDRVFAEQYLEGARHIEVQIIGDGTGDVAHLYERECTLQRRNQKLAEIAPSPSITPLLRSRLIQAALTMAQAGRYRNLGTFEFLVLAERNLFFFMEANPRLQVEHTVTEQTTGLDLVALQLQVALGSTLAELGLGKSHEQLPLPFRTAIQLRVNAEAFDEVGAALPVTGKVSSLSLPSGPGIRVDTAAHAPLPNGTVYQANPAFDSLFLKLVCTAPTYTSAIALAQRALEQLDVQGCETNQQFLRALLAQKVVGSNTGIHTGFVQNNMAALLKMSAQLAEEREPRPSDTMTTTSQASTPEGYEAVAIPMAGVILKIDVNVGTRFDAGQQLALVEAMKMEHVIRAPKAGTVDRILANIGDSVPANTSLLVFQPSDAKDVFADTRTLDLSKQDLEVERPELATLRATRLLLTDEARSAAVEKRHALGYLTARENLALLVDEGTFIEFGDLTMAAQRQRMDEDRLRSTTMGDGVITGFASINASVFEGGTRTVPPTRCAICIYDYMVLAGTQGHFHHLKLDRLFQSVINQSVPLVLYAEGGGGRPGDVDVTTKITALDTPSFILLGQIRARGLPTIGVANGYTFAGNAALLGTTDLVIATLGGEGLDVEDRTNKKGRTSIGMSGPQMIEGAKMGRHAAADIGPTRVHALNGNVDVVVPSEREAAKMAKVLLGYFQGPEPTKEWKHTSDPKILRHALPVDRKRAYDVRDIIRNLSDDDSFIELGQDAAGKSLITGFLRVEGQPLAVIASSVISPLGGAIDLASAIKATRILQLLKRTQAMHLLVLCDTPGFMVGPDAEAQGAQTGIGQVKAFGDWFAAAAEYSHSGGQVFALTLRKAYGLGAQAMLGGSTLSNFCCAAWPTGEFAGMGPEGAVRLAMRKELAAIEDEKEREETYKALVDVMYERGRAENIASMLEIDTVIDPIDTRLWLLRCLAIVRPSMPVWRSGGLRSKI